MKKFLSILLALTLLLGMCVTAHAEEPVTITWFMRGANNAYMEARTRELVGLKKIMEIANVNIDFTIANGNNQEIDTQYIAMMASGNYPDAIHWLHQEAYVGGWTQMYNDGICIELNDVIDKYMPNYKAFLEANPEIASSLMNDAGQYLYFPCINPMETIEDVMAVTYFGLLIRQDWLDNVGLAVPTNMDEWYEVLTAFKEGDPNGNGLQDELPFVGGGAGISLFQPAFGFSSGVYVDPDTGKVGYGQYTEKYKAYLETMSKWYAEGLITDVYDENGNGTTDVDSWVIADLAGSWKGLANAWGQHLPTLREKNPNAAYTAVPWPTAANGVSYGGYNNISYINRYSTVISTSASPEHVEAVARLIDVMYTEEGSLLTTWGTLASEDDPGSYYVDENGKRHQTDWAIERVEFHGGKFQRQRLYAHPGNNFPRIGMNDFEAAAREEDYVNACLVWSEAERVMGFPPAATLSADEAAAATVAVDEMGTYIQEMEWKFITGQEPLTNFDQYIDQLEKMGIENLIAAYQAAYDRDVARTEAALAK